MDCQIRFDYLEKQLSKFFLRYGVFVARHPLPFLICPIILTAVLCIGLGLREIVTDAQYLYTPTDAPSIHEKKTIEQLFPIEDGTYFPGKMLSEQRTTQVVVVAKNNSNILEFPFDDAVFQLNLFIIQNLAVYFEGKRYTYQDICLHTMDNACYNNPQIAFANYLMTSSPGLANNFTYPVSYTGYRSVYFGSTLGQVGTSKNPNPTNVDEVKSGVVKSARAWLLLYQTKFDSDSKKVTGAWEMELEKALLNYQKGPGAEHLDIAFFHSQTLSNELRKNAKALTPRFAFLFGAIIMFATACSVRLIPGTVFIDWVQSKPTLALIGVINAAMGVLSSLGLLGLFQFKYNDVVSVMPFLVVATGVDNMFIMQSDFRHTSRAWSVEKRVSTCISEAAVAIFITALTDFLSFAIGAYSSIPADRIFCIYTAIAILFNFIYQITFFVGCLVLFAKLEERERHVVFLIETIPNKEKDSLDLFQKFWLMGTRFVRPKTEDPDPPEDNPHLPSPSNVTVHKKKAFFRDYYGPFLMRPVSKVVSMLLLGLYLGVAIYGCLHVRQGLKPQNLLLKGSPAIDYYTLLGQYFLPYGQEMQVLVDQVPDLSNETVRDEVIDMIYAFGNTSHTIQVEGFQCWLLDYMLYLRKFTQYYKIVTTNPRAFNLILRNDYLSLNQVRRWRGDIIFQNESELISTDPPIYGDPYNVSKFRFSVGLRNFEDFEEQRRGLLELRALARSFPQYNLTIYSTFWPFADQYNMILPNTIQNVVIGLVAMMAIALLTIPHPMVCLWVGFTICSIDIGVIGYMTLWGINMDAISMITIVVSLGFSVAYSAHISYGYVTSHESTPSGRVSDALEALGWPLLQGATCTILGVLALATVKSYIVQTFFKNMFLVIIIGVTHALVFLPVLLSLFVPSFCFCKKYPTISDAVEIFKHRKH